VSDIPGEAFATDLTLCTATDITNAADINNSSIDDSNDTIICRCKTVATRPDSVHSDFGAL